MSVQRFADVPQMEIRERTKFITDFYQITLKKECPCKMKYGENQYDFNEGVMSFFSPKQVSTIEPGNLFPPAGWLLSVYPDLLNAYPLAQKIKEYAFFEYSMDEGLIMKVSQKKIDLCISIS